MLLPDPLISLLGGVDEISGSGWRVTMADVSPGVGESDHVNDEIYSQLS